MIFDSRSTGTQSTISIGPRFSGITPMNAELAIKPGNHSRIIQWPICDVGPATCLTLQIFPSTSETRLASSNSLSETYFDSAYPIGCGSDQSSITASGILPVWLTGHFMTVLIVETKKMEAPYVEWADKSTSLRPPFTWGWNDPRDRLKLTSQALCRMWVVDWRSCK